MMILKKTILALLLIVVMVIFMSTTYNTRNSNDSEISRQTTSETIRIINSNIVKGVTSSPRNGTDSVLLNNKLTVTFNRKMDPSTINGTTFTLKGKNDVPGIVTYNGYIATFIPSTALDPNQVYTAILSTSATSEKNVHLTKDYTWTFTTENTSLELAAN
jgi:hypothetical protein